nr:ubiquitin hydrolase [Tanacetum cinerariifolium]
MSWIGVPEFADDTITDYTRPSTSVESNPNDLQNKSSSASENGESTGSILSKPEIKFMKPADSPTVAKTNKNETVRKPTIKYAEMYRKTSKRSNVRGNQRNWNNQKSQQLGKNFLMKKACYNCGGFDHLSYDCDRSPTRINRPNVNSARPRTTQDLMIILIQRVKRLKRELKARTPPIKIHKVDRGRSMSVMAWVPKKMQHQVWGRIVGNKMHKAFPLPVMSSYCQKKFPLLVRKVPPDEEKRCHC